MAARASANGIELCYDTFGDRSKPALLLIMGLAAQMIAWEEEFCERLAAHGYFVIRFDNRDIGLSTKFPQHGAPDSDGAAGPGPDGQARRCALRTARYGSRRGRPPRCARHRSCARGRRVDGRRDRPGDGDPPRRAPALADLDHVVDRRPSPAARRRPKPLPCCSPRRRPTGKATSRATSAPGRCCAGPAFRSTRPRTSSGPHAAWERGLNPPGVARQLAAILASGRSHRRARRRARADARHPRRCRPAGAASKAAWRRPRRFPARAC